MKYEKSITINRGDYRSLKVGVTDAPSYEECDRAIIDHLNELSIPIDDEIKRCLAWNGLR